MTHSTRDIGRVEDIEYAIDRLMPEEFSRIARWVHERDQQRWDKQFDSDSISGRPDFLFEEAENESKEGLVREWPPAK